MLAKASTSRLDLVLAAFFLTLSTLLVLFAYVYLSELYPSIKAVRMIPFIALAVPTACAGAQMGFNYLQEGAAMCGGAEDLARGATDREDK